MNGKLNMHGWETHADVKAIDTGNASTYGEARGKYLEGHWILV